MPWLLAELALAEPDSVDGALREHVLVLTVEAALATLALLLGLGLLGHKVWLLDRLLKLLLLLIQVN